jgi:predicted nucleotidyltransferase
VNNDRYYFGQLYPLQDQALKLIRSVETGFYLTGGTAASRAYLHHRFSDDLDLFVDDDVRFGLWADRLIQKFTHEMNWQCQVIQREERFVRINLSLGDLSLKVEMINDVPARVGTVVDHPVLGHLDTAENILANKVTALLDREEPKDFADIWGFCTLMNLSLKKAITDAESKSAGIFPADLARLLCTVSQPDWAAVRWISAPPEDSYLSQLKVLGEKLLLDV